MVAADEPTRSARGCLERAHPVQALEQRDAEGEDVAPLVDDVAAHLLGGHVRGRADELIGPGDEHLEGATGARPRRRREGVERRRRRGCHGAVEHPGQPRQAEVEHPDPAIVADQHVVRLEVAVDQAPCVGRGEPASGVDHDGDDLPPRTAGLEPRPQRLALDVLHGDEGLRAHQAGVVDGNDVRVRELGKRLGLALQPARALVRGAHAHQLQGDLAIELGIVRGVDDAHPALAQGPLDLVAAYAVPGDERSVTALWPRGRAGGDRRVVIHRRGPSSPGYAGRDRASGSTLGSHRNGGHRSSRAPRAPRGPAVAR